MRLNMKAVLATLLVGISGLMLFVPVVDGADEIKGMFVLLTGIAVRDYFSADSAAKNIAAVKQAYDPAPGPVATNDD
jgi:hypothetical protein